MFLKENKQEQNCFILILLLQQRRYIYITLLFGCEIIEI